MFSRQANASYVLPHARSLPNMTYEPSLIIANLVREKAATTPDLDVLTFEDEGQSVSRTYSELWRNGQRIAAALRERGMQAGDRFALVLQNHPEFVEAMVASAILGTVFVPIDCRTRRDRLAHMLRDSGCSGAISGNYALPELLSCVAAVPSLQWVLVVGEEMADFAAQHTRIDALADVLPKTVRDLPIATISAMAPMQIMYTSGTTGDPRGIMVRHARFGGMGATGETVFGYRDEDRPYTGLSLTHGNAQFATLSPALHMGLRAVFSRRFTKSRLWEVIRKYGCTTFTLLGGMATAIYCEPAKPEDADNPVRFVISAGMPKVLWEDFARRFDIQILELYAAMEGGLTINPIGIGPIGSCGRVPPNLHAKIVDELGRDVPPNTPGEIWFRPADGSPAVVDYFNNPRASAEKTEGGWLHSGDVVIMDEKGWVFFQHRKGGGIRHNGDFINQAYLEKAIAEHPGVADVAVFGVPAASGAPGEKDVVAAVVPIEGSALDPESIFAWCRRRLEANMVPSFLMAVVELPKTASEKVQPRFLIERFHNRDARVYAENEGVS